MLRRVALLLLSIVLIRPVAAQQPAPTQRIDSLVTAYHEAGLFNGAVLVGRGDSAVYAKGIGDADMEWNVENTPSTRFHIGSVTKQFTAALILQLVEEGAVALDSTISTYLPDYPGPGADEITIHHLLTHRSGIPSFTSFEDYQSRIMRLEWEPDSLVSTFASRPLDFEPGSQYSYSNSGYVLLGVLIQKVIGEGYSKALRERVLAPVGLNEDIGYAHDDQIIEREARGYEQTVWGYRPAEPIDSSVPLSAGMLYATPEGLHHWTIALHSGQVLPDSLYDTMTTRHSENGYGYGLVMQTDTIGGEGISVTQHGGGINGFRSSLGYVEPEGYTLVVLDNSGSPHASRLWEGILNLLYGESPPQPRPSVASPLWDVLQDDDVAAAKTRYQQLQEERPTAYTYGPAELVSLGDALREKDRPEPAVEIYEYALSMDSTLVDAYAGLGHAEKTLGRTDAARRHLKAALNRNPSRSDAKAALREMGISIETTTVELSVEVLERYTGVYAAGPRPGFKMTITRQGTQLYAQATGQSRFKIYPSSETRFYLKVVDAQIEFIMKGDTVPSLTLYQEGRKIPFNRTAETAN